MEEVRTETEANQIAAERKADKPKGVTVAKPTTGCPVPRLRLANLKARAVLSEFLSGDQMCDFENSNQFVSFGAETGHAYAVTSRYAAGLNRMTFPLYDLDEKRPICVHHDLMVPAAEEMLSIHLMLQFPHHELYLRGGVGEMPMRR
jgi:hypothetical protein